MTPIERLQARRAPSATSTSATSATTTVGKLTGRYDFSPAFALRGTVATGFRAPTLAEEFYSATNVSPTSAFVQLPPNSAAATLVGFDEPEAGEVDQLQRRLRRPPGRRP